MYAPSAVNAPKAREILERKISEGRKSAATLLERIHTQYLKDVIVDGGSLRFAPQDKILTVSRGGPVLRVHAHALNQLAGRAGVPTAYLSGLVEAGGWQATLAADILARHYGQGEPSTKFLVRTVDGQMRGFLSDKFRRLDSRPLIDAFAEECQRIGAVPVDGTSSDVRVAMKSIIPTVFEPVPGEVMAFGIEWANSDFGAGRHTLRAFVLRLWCLNGATLEDVMTQVHLGARLSADLALSQRTYDLDTRTSMSALRDVVASTVSPKAIEAMCGAIKNAHEKEISWKNVSGKLAKRLLKGELEAAREAFEGPDNLNLPEGKSIWRASNAVSWIAGQATDNDRKLELQRFAGEVLSGKAESVQLAA